MEDKEFPQKKVLSLVLCVAVMLSVMVMGAGAAFSDQDKIENKEAVDMCAALNIIGGYPDGSYKPAGNIKRSEICKMICVALNGGQEPNVSTNSKPTFNDVRGTNAAWAEGYIEACVAQGIVSGVGGGRFSPNGNVTGTQLAKMLLVCLGYNSDNESFTGNAWETNVNVRAAQKGLYDGLENMDTAAALTRDNAAQMVWNAMNAYEVEYKTTIVTDANGNLITQVTPQDKVVGSTNDKITLLRDKYDAWVYVGTLVSVDGNSIEIAMSSSDRNASDPVPDNTKTSETFTKLTVDYSNLLGQKVEVMFKGGKTNEVLGVYATSDNTVYSTLMNQVSLDGSKVKFDGTSYSVDGQTIKTYVDDDTATDKPLSYFDDTAANKVSMNKVIFVDADGNNKIDTAIITTYTGGQVTYVGSDKITFNGKSYNFSDENIDKSIEKDDYAVLSTNLYEDCKDIVRADIVTGELTGYREKSGYVQYELDGKWYNMKEEDSDVTTGDTVKAYIFNGVILDMDTDEGTGAFPGDVAVVVGKGTSGLDGDQAKVRFFDGTEKKVTMSDDSVAVKVGTAYKVSGSDSDMKFEALTLHNKYNGFEYISAQANAQGGNVDKIANVAVADDAAIILYTDAGRSKQITGKQFKALADNAFTATNAATAVFTKESDGLTRVMMAAVKVQSTDLVGQSSDNYAYIVTGGVKTASGDVKYTIWTGSENKTVIEDTSYSKNIRAQGTLIGYSEIDKDNNIKDVTVYGTIQNAKDAGASYTAGTMYRGGNEANVAKYIAVNGAQLNVTGDTTVLLVDSKADDDSKIGLKYTSGDKLPEASSYTEGGADKYLVNAFWIMDESGNDDVDIDVLVIDSTGAFDGFELEDINAPKTTVTADVDNEASMTFGTSETLKFDLAARNYEVSDVKDVTVKATVKDANGDVYSTGITGDLTSNVTLDMSGDGADTASEKTLIFGTSTAAGKYTIEITATYDGKANVIATVPFEVLPKQATETAPAFTGTVTGGTIKVKEITTSMFSPVGSSYTITSLVVKVDGVELVSGADLLYVIQDGDTVTADVTVTAAKNYSFDDGMNTHVFKDVSITVS